MIACLAARPAIGSDVVLLMAPTSSSLGTCVDAGCNGHIAFSVVDFVDRYGPWAVVAGASAGVGASAARELGRRGINVVLVSRRQSALDDVARTVSSLTRTVVLDLSEPDAGSQLVRATAGLEIGL